MTSRRTLAGAWQDVVAIAGAWAIAVLVESMLVVLLWGREFSAAWEMAQVRRVAVPLAVAALVPASVVLAGWWRVALHAGTGSRLARRALAALGALAGCALGLGVSTGRHFANVAVRASFCGVLALAGLAVGALLVPRFARLASRPVALALAGMVVAALAWVADAGVLPRLYPAFHAALFVAFLSGAGVAGIGVRLAWEGPRWAARAAVAVVAVAVVGAFAFAPHAVRALERLSNLRIVLVEHAPVLGRVVVLVEALHPEPAELPPGAPSVVRGEIAQALDWAGHDVVLVTVDALRADHVGAYGYARATTPNLDALAREGTLFEDAYCPTPHTSYSITSMMTGKYLRPLLALGLGEDSETWAQDLRRYGWRTAAFYPPAVFFIDEERFPRFERETLGFEYAKVEFADPVLREQQIAGYLDGAPAGTPLFLWVHFFEPHEPYVMHAEHPFAGGRSADEDAYDSEVATADDGIDRVVRLVRARRPGAAVIVTADHGEEFGDHGGRYHGTTVYEEQVRVPLVVAGPGVRAGAHVDTVVQTIDLLPTVLSALGIPRPARLRGRDLGPVLRGEPGALDAGFAFAETDDYALVAEGPDRLVCERRASACALYRPKDDPTERKDLARSEPARFDAMRGELRAVERDHGRFEGAGGPAWPEALRRGMQGDAEAALDVAALLDDANVVIRRKAAEVCFGLHAPSTAPQLRRAVARDEDDEVRRWAALALGRIPDEALPASVRPLLEDPSRDWRRRAALALGERGDARACDELAAWWSDVLPPPGQGKAEGEPPRLTIELPAAEDLLAATARARCRSAVPSLLAALADVRARPYVADALGALGDDRARGPLRELLASEPYVTTRPREARALLALRAADWVPAAASAPPADAAATLAASAGPSRLVVMLSDPSAAVAARMDGDPVTAWAPDGAGQAIRIADVPGPPGQDAGARLQPRARVEVHASSGGVAAFWLVPTGPT
ncbi:MAG TPA: sulfatase-like hydrolase/transferase [Polyangiaceae bacterium]|jgi:HEAT repeat protein